MNRSSRKFLTLFFMLLITSVTFAQYVPGKERGDSGKRTKGQLEGNRVRTTIHNFGFTGRTGGEFPINVQTPYEWPKNTGQVYLALTAMFVGGEVIDNRGEAIKIVDVPTYRTADDGTSWNFEPTPGYFNDDRPTREVASSSDETTWPGNWPDRMSDETDPGWEGSWNGLGGKNDFRADQEIFYRASDDLYSRYSTYFPDSTDMSRKGMGILMDVRALAWSQFLVQDAIYVLHNVKNDGTEDIPKTAVTAWHADFVGGNGDSQDDISEFDLLVDIGFSYDANHRAPDFGSDPVGIIGQAFLETPGNSTDRVDNDGDGEELGPKVTEEMLAGETVGDLIDNNGNGLIDENEAHIPFQDQEGVTYADRIDQNGNAEENSPVVTAEMVNLVSSDQWNRWPANPEIDKVHLIEVESDDVGFAYADFIDNNDNGEEDSPTITQAMIDQAANDAPYFRVELENGIVLYDVKSEDLGKQYADGIDNDNNGAIDEFIDEGIDEMVDESRDNGIDDEGDWNVLTDDVGLDGVADTGDEGEGDGKPTSGARFGLPGEPNIDVTDVSETDQIGITNAQYDAAGSWDFNSVSDEVIWFRLMRPGRFYDPQEVIAGEYDLFISSGFFPLKSGQTEPISVSVILANGPVPDPEGVIRKNEIIRKKVRVQETYENDYQFANAPLSPTLKAVAGDNRVTLYWDKVAETSFDTYISNIGGNGFDFEGYKLYRSQDPAFQDAENITSGFGIPTFKTPIATFDLDDNYFGFDSVGISGVRYYLGDNSGLQHSYVDTSVKNGFTYYYALVAYDFGFPQGEILPTESPIKLSLQPDGTIVAGENVVQISPEAPTAGYVEPTLGKIDLSQGTTTSKVSYKIVDKLIVKDQHTYSITFEDTLKVGQNGESDTLTTKNFTLVDETDGVTLIDKGSDLSGEQPIIDGFQLIFTNEEKVEIDKTTSGWNNEGIMDFVFEKLVTPTEQGEQRPNDYLIVFGDVGLGTSQEMELSNNTFPSQDVNFQVFNKSTQSPVDFGFVDLETSDGPGILSAAGARRDRVVFLEEDQNGDQKKTWWFYLSGDDSDGVRFPTNDDTADVNLKKPFLSADRFEFTTSAGKTDASLAKEDLNNIKVVPNPYVGSAKWELKNPYNTGRGPRSLHFTHLPPQCTIRIFTVNGELVNTLHHESQLNDGTYEWDMLTKDRLAISYGIYIFHIEAPGIGDKTGKFAIIK